MLWLLSLKWSLAPRHPLPEHLLSHGLPVINKQHAVWGFGIYNMRSFQMLYGVKLYEIFHLHKQHGSTASVRMSVCMPLLAYSLQNSCLK